ncbi:hypothetical protein DL93DRAFT_2072999, partial [Clavulina sp. PMI_390]
MTTEGRTLQSTAGFKEWLQRVWGYNPANLSDELIDTLLERYPDVPSEGAPYANPSVAPTDFELDPSDRIFEPLESNQFKRAASYKGDLLFESGRRLQLEFQVGAIDGAKQNLAEKMMAALDRRKSPIWSYHYRQPTTTRGAPNWWGVYHSAEVPAAFAKMAEEDSEEGGVSRAMSRAWIRFAANLDPNGPEVPDWPMYDANWRSTLQIRSGNMTIVKDDWRSEAIKFLNSKEFALATGR